MNDEGASQQLERLEAAVTADPGATGFSALAELHRRAGRLADAEARVRAGLALKPDAWEGRVALALVLLDRGLDVEARDELERLLEADAALQGLSLTEEPANAIPVASPPEPEVFEAEVARDEDEPAPAGVRVGAPFVTGTMADLLERQGDLQGAERIRANLHANPAAAGAEDANEHIIAELSRWLANAQQRIEERA